ncbi:MAG: adenylate/guanylate cyclase domain-containing protein [Treponema sp.]|nr:adenylate/guanylate cyclase domain-containing protein [Treponema sp.]
MKIAPRIILLFLPIVVAPMAFQTYSSAVSARDGIAEVASSLLRLETEELLRFAESQSRLLGTNGLASSPDYVAAAEETVADFAKGLARRPGEEVFALGKGGAIAFSTGAASLSAADLSALRKLAALGDGWRDFRLAEAPRVAYVAAFPPFGWTFFVTESRDAFFAPVTRIVLRNVVVGAASAAVAAALLVAFAGFITKPIRRVAQSMHAVVTTEDLSRRVELPYDDEIGDLGDSFNAMLSSLEHAFSEIKSYALDAAIAHKRENRIRNIFQKYVPRQVIDRFFASPDSMLVGEDREIAILFSDIRDFTAYSEGLDSRKVVESLNEYFALMVDAVARNDGTPDKYIGDALMAFYGAPADDEESAEHAVATAFEMLQALEGFNRAQLERGRRTLSIGIGINFGSATVGNIGSERKMDYTVIGDMVNLGSRLEGLTKHYHEPIIVSDSVRLRIEERYPCRMVDRVRVKGREAWLDIYAPRTALGEAEERGWGFHALGLERYYARAFVEAAEHFRQVLACLPGDRVAGIYLERCTALVAMPPGPEWRGVITFEEK